MIRVKICGITNKRDALQAVESGADALGFIFAESPRRITPEQAKDIISCLPPFITTVGVFVNASEEEIKRIIQYCGIDMVQLHGDESPRFCNLFMPRTIKSLRVNDASILEKIPFYKGYVRAILLDTYDDRLMGGTGISFDWQIAVNTKRYGIPLILSGGLRPENIFNAIEIVKPFAVDVNSGVEIKPGRKSGVLMRSLFINIKKGS